MNRIAPLSSDQADEKTLAILNSVKSQLGRVPNMFQTLAHSHAVLDAYTKQSAALAAGTLEPKIREQIALISAARNHCDYCASAHTALGKMAGLDIQEIEQNLNGRASDPKSQAALTFADRIIDTRGNIDSDDMSVAREHFNDAEIVEIIAHVALNIFTNYFNRVADVEVDFPLVSTRDLAASA